MFSPRPSPCRLWAAAWCRAPRWWAAAWCPWEQVTSLAASHQPPASHLFKLKLQNTFNTSNNRDREAQLQPQGCWLLEPNILETSQKCYFMQSRPGFLLSYLFPGKGSPLSLVHHYCGEIAVSTSCVAAAGCIGDGNEARQRHISRAANEPSAKFSQSRRRPLLHLRHY